MTTMKTTDHSGSTRPQGKNSRFRQQSGILSVNVSFGLSKNFEQSYVWDNIKNLSVVPPVAPYPPPGVEASELPQQITQLPTEYPYVGKPHNFDAERSPPV